MTNKQRQPVMQKAAGSPQKGASAAVAGKVDTNPNARLEGKPLDDGKRDES